MILHIRNKLVYRSFLLFLLAISLILLWRINGQFLSNPSYIPVDDFSHYWAAGHLALEGENPYDPSSIQVLRNLITGNLTNYTEIPIAWTPPWSLALLMPFGSLPYTIARMSWLLISIGIVMVSAEKIWQVYYRNRKHLWVVWIMAFSFGPTISVLEKGQITPWVLAGITGFIYFITIKPNDWLAGFFICLVSLKPQLFYLFWPALLFWILLDKRWIILIGAILSVIIMSLPGLILNPDLFSQYFQAILYNSPSNWATPTIGGYLRLMFGIDKFYLQLIPSLLGLSWFIVYWLRNKQPWDWTKKLPTILFASILTSAYAWTYDQVILLLAILPALSSVISLNKKYPSWIYIISLTVVNFLDLVLHRKYDEFWFGWVAPAYLVCVLIGYWIARPKEESSQIMAPRLQEHIE